MKIVWESSICNRRLSIYFQVKKTETKKTKYYKHIITEFLFITEVLSLNYPVSSIYLVYDERDKLIRVKLELSLVGIEWVTE